MERDILKDLNEEQRLAAECTDGPVMVLAGAGSGKTRVLTYRLAHLLNKGADPFSVLALTFTNKAAREMKERITRLVGSSDARNVWMGTFHSVFARILRTEGHLLGYLPGFSIYDTDDSKSAIKSILKEQNIDPKVYQPGYILHRISMAKNNLISHEDYAQNADLTDYDKSTGKPLISDIFTRYQNRLRLSSAMDFDDLLFNMNVLLRDFPEMLYRYQQKFVYIMVDEYQDTNYAQYMIIRKLAANNENICVVGDDAQSIYGFRGANIQNILNFKSDYPDAKTFKLEQNYRSTVNIVSAANSVIAKNKKQYFKEIWTENETGNLISLMRASTDNEEGVMIAQSVFENRMNHHVSNDQFAILYRTNAQSRAIEEALRKMNIPYRIYGGLSFYKRKEIKDMTAYFRLAVNPLDEEALMRVINYPGRGIGDTTIHKILVTASEHNKCPWDVVSQPESFRLQVNTGILQKLNDFTMMIRSFASMVGSRNAYELARHIAYQCGIIKDLKEDNSPEGMARLENIEELLNAIKEFSENEQLQTADGTGLQTQTRTLDLFMQDIALLTDADSDDKENTDKVSLMTIHAAKGLEFPYVYVSGMEENLFPSIQSLNDRDGIEEERRLFYVAITRAMKKLTLSYAENRYRYGEIVFCEPSRFLDEIDPKYLDQPRKTPHQFGGNQPAPKGLTFSPPPPAFTRKPMNLKKIGTETGQVTDTGAQEDIRAGMIVEHQRFGTGKVLNVEGSGPNKKTTVFFEGVGQKQLLLQYARLKVVKQ